MPSLLRCSGKLVEWLVSMYVSMNVAHINNAAFKIGVGEVLFLAQLQSVHSTLRSARILTRRCGAIRRTASVCSLHSAICPDPYSPLRFSLFTPQCGLPESLDAISKSFSLSLQQSLLLMQPVRHCG